MSIGSGKILGFSESEFDWTQDRLALYWCEAFFMSKERQEQVAMSKWKLGLAGLVVGALSGLLGVGGGIFIVPILVGIFAFQQHRAQAISQGVVLPTAIVSSYFYFQTGLIDNQSVTIAASMAVFSMVCAAYGVKVMKNLPANTLKKAFGLLMVVAGIKMMWG